MDLPPKFKVAQFPKLKGDENLEFHLKHYCTKMGAHSRDEGVLIMFFHVSLEGPAYDWFMNLDHKTIQSLEELANMFTKYYHHNTKNVPTRDQVRALKMKSNESFREYASRWRQVAMEVRPIMEEPEIITHFIRTLHNLFYTHMIALNAKEFSDLIEIGERLDVETKEGRLDIGNSISKKGGPTSVTTHKKKEGEVSFVDLTPGNQNYSNDSNS